MIDLKEIQSRLDRGVESLTDTYDLLREVERLRQLLPNAGWPREAEGVAELATGAEHAAEEDLVRVLRRVLDENKLREAHGEDTIGVLMKCGAFYDTEVAALAARIEAVERLQSYAADCEQNAKFATNKATALEREAVVAYLLRDFDTDDSRDRAAEAIRNGEHPREGDE